MTDYDAIVIGAGNAGLVAAASLQRGGLQTLLVERHNVPGGCATSFRRGRFEFETALHQLSGVGHPDQGFTLRPLFAGLGVELDFVEERDLYRYIVPGVHDVTIPADWTKAIDALDAAYPGQRQQLTAFFELIRTVAVWQVMARRGLDPAQVDPVLFAEGLRPTKAVIEERLADPGLRAALLPYWTYLGQPPSRLPFQDYALLMFAYLEFKPWHIVGGSQAMSSAILTSFLEAGGQVRFNTAVERILIRDGRAAGVQLEGGAEVTAPHIVSNASLPVTWAMVDPARVPAEVRADMGTRRIGISGFMLYLGLAATPAELGFTTSTTFIETDSDDDRIYAATKTLAGPPGGIIATSYDVAPIGFAPTGASHMSVMCLQYASAWDGIAPRDYLRTKYAYAGHLLDLVERVSPGFRDAIEEVDVATPLTVMRYLGHPGGAIYGYDQDATDSWLFRADDLSERVPGLRLAGSWTSMGGFQPTLEAGARAARRILRSARAGEPR